MKNVTKISFITVILMLLVIIAPIKAAQYKFSVPENTVNVFINQDGSVDINYFITFTNSHYGKTIDIVDIGLPNDSYKLTTAEASIEEDQLNGIAKSTYISTGVEVPLGKKSIPPGDTKTLNFKIKNDKMIFQDDSDERFASLEFYPNYFGSEYTEGSTNLQVTFILPPGVTKDNVVARHNPDVEFTTQKNGQLNVTWKVNSASPSKMYKFGLSFPKDSVQTVYPASEYTPAKDFYTYSSNSSSSNLSDGIFTFCGFGAYFVVFIFISIISAFFKRGNKYKYLPPSGVLEGFGANKQLNPPEVAILNELPLARVSTIFLAKYIKLGIINDIHAPFALANLSLHSDIKSQLNKDELDFLNVLKHYVPGARKQKTFEKELKDFYIDFIEKIANNLKKYDRKETTHYYKEKVLSLWDEIELCSKSNDVFKKRKITSLLDENFMLLLTDKNFIKKIKLVLEDPEIPKPKWIKLLRKVKDEITDSVSNAEVEEEFAEDDDYYYYDYDLFDEFYFFEYAHMDQVNLAVTKNTNPALFASSSSYSGGGGCACACACACAGGGR